MKLKEERIVKFGSKLPNLPLLTQQVRQKGEKMSLVPYVIEQTKRKDFKEEFHNDREAFG